MVVTVPLLGVVLGAPLLGVFVCVGPFFAPVARFPECVVFDAAVEAVAAGVVTVVDDLPLVAPEVVPVAEDVDV